jgi:hypothetical protein
VRRRRWWWRWWRWRWRKEIVCKGSESSIDMYNNDVGKRFMK